jgi:hypothetical protein
LKTSISFLNPQLFSLKDARLEKRHRFRKEIDPAGNHQQKRKGQQPPEEVL